MYAGRNTLMWNGIDDEGRNVPSGLYIIALEVGDQKVRTKTIVVRNQ